MTLHIHVSVSDFCPSLLLYRILAAELWHQDKNNVAKELGQLRKLKMQQVLKEMEEQDEFKAAQEYYGEKAYQEWMQVTMLAVKVRQGKQDNLPSLFS